MERAVAAEERRAFLLPHCRYICMQSFLISLTVLHSSHALLDVVDALRAPHGTALLGQSMLLLDTASLCAHTSTH